MKALKVCDVVTKTKLHKLYWHGAAYELTQCGYVEDLTYSDDAPRRKKGEVKKYKIVKDLPEKAAFGAEVTDRFFVAPIEEWLQDSLSEIECIKDEMTDWRDNLEQNEGLSQTSKADEVREAADALEYIDIPSNVEELPEFLRDQEDDEGNVIRPALRVQMSSMLSTIFSWRSKRNLSGRSARLHDHAAVLSTCAESIREEADNEKCPWTPEQREEAVEIAGSLEDIASELENVECPGMF